MSIADELLKLQQLKDAGALTEFEYDTAKAKLLADPTPTYSVPVAPVYPVSQSGNNVTFDIGPRANRFANYQIVLGLIGLVIFLVVLCTVIIPAFNSASEDPGFPGGTITCTGPDMNDCQ